MIFYANVSSLLLKNSSYHLQNPDILTRVLPLPSKDFHCFRLGKLEIPAAIIIGSPETVFTSEEVIINFDPIFRHQQADYPDALSSSHRYLVDKAKIRYRIGQIEKKVENVVPRLTRVSQEPETEMDKRGRLYIYLSLTTYDTFLATNKSLDYSVIPDPGLFSRFTSNVTIRDAYCKIPFINLSESV